MTDYRYVRTAKGWKWVPLHMAQCIWAMERRRREAADEARIDAMPKWSVA